MKRRILLRIGIGVLAAGIAVGLYFLFLACFERKDVTRWHPESEAARTDFHLGLVRTLAARGVEQRRLADSASFDGRGLGFVVADGLWCAALDEAGRKSFNAWLRAGGRAALFLGAEADIRKASEIDAFLAPYGLGVPSWDREGFSWEKGGTITLPGYVKDAALLIHFGPVLETEASTVLLSSAKEEKGLRWGEVRTGKGSLVVCGDSIFLMTDALSEDDRSTVLAYLFDAFVPDNGSPGKAAAKKPAVGVIKRAQLKDYARFPWPSLILPFLLLAGALVWARAPRFGPVASSPEAPRRSLLERFRAEGRYLRRRAPRGSLEALMAASFRRAVEASLPGLDDAARIRILAERSGLDQKKIASLLNERAGLPRPAADFAESMNAMERVRKYL